MDTKQNWKGMDGSIAWHLIDRQAENWNQVGKMMNDWFIENIPTKEWVGLTDEDIENCFDESCHLKVVDPKGGIKGSVNIFEVGRAIVQLCKERNT